MEPPPHEKGSQMDVHAASPREIDTELAAIHGRFHAASNAVEDLASRLSHYHEQVIELEAELDAARAAAAAAWAEGDPHRAEFRLRGGWTRAFLVDGNNGHVHSSMECNTCFDTTQFVWLPEYSGGTEEAVVNDAGEQACTVCYPSAPVDVLRRKSRIEAPARREARIAREARSAELAAKRAKNAIANPDGSPLEVFDWHIPEREYRERDGGTRVVPAHDRFKTLTTVTAAKSWLTDSHSAWTTGTRSEDITAVAAALAAKLDTDAETEIAAAKKRAAKRH